MNSTGLKTSTFGRPTTAPAGGGALEVLRGLTRQQQLLRAGIVLGAAAGMAVTAAAGDLSGPGIAVVGAGVIVAVARPDSHAAAVAILAFAIQWFAGVDDARTPWTVAAAACLLVIHTSAALAAIAPPTASSPQALLQRWARRAGIVLGVAVVVWGLSRALDEADTPSNVVLAAAGALALLGLIRLFWPRQS